MATLAYSRIAIAGTLAAPVAAAAGGDKVAPNDRGFVDVNNGSGASINVTIAVPGNTSYGLAQPDVVTAVAAGARRRFGPFPADLADPADGLVAIAYSAVTSVTVEALTI